MKWVVQSLKNLGTVALAWGLGLAIFPWPIARIVHDTSGAASVVVEHSSRWTGVGIAVAGALILVATRRLRQGLKSRDVALAECAPPR